MVGADVASALIRMSITVDQQFFHAHFAVSILVH